MSRERFLEWTQCLLDPMQSPHEHRQAADAWCSWALERLGVDENDPRTPEDPFLQDTLLASGKAISPLKAAHCVRDYRRTTVFLQAMDAALRAARVRFAGEPIHVLEAGCGPLAPLSLALALCYSPSEVHFTLLDLHPRALEAARILAADLGVIASIRTIAADATTVRFAENERPHVIACELVSNALRCEPQVSATLNLAPQLLPGGFFLPKRIDVRAALFDSGKFQRRMLGENTEPFVELGRVFSMEASALERLDRFGDHGFEAAAITVPPHDSRTPLHLCTRVQIFGQHQLSDFDSSLNLPRPVRHSREFEAGGVAKFYFRLSQEPGLYLKD